MSSLQKRVFPVAALAVAALGLYWSTAHAAANPDWTGRWVIADGFQDAQDGTSVGFMKRGELARPPPGEQPQFKGVYLAMHNAHKKELAAAEAAGKYMDVAGADCRPLGMPRFWFGPYTFEFIVNGKQINLFQEAWEQTRRIYLDGRPHPSLDDVEPLYQGHSIGHWEGGTLVVDTVNISQATRIGIDEHSEVMHVMERFTQTAPDTLEIAMIVDDAKALAKPWVSSIRLHRKADMEVVDYICSENNRNPVGADGSTAIKLKSN